jgi:acetate kinase
MRDIEDGFVAGHALEVQILNIYVNRILKYIGAYTASMNGVDVIVMAAGVLERSPIIRKFIVSQLGRLGVTLDETANDCIEAERVISTPESNVTVMVVPTNEEYMIAKDTSALVK